MAEKLFKLTMENGAEHIIRSVQSMFEISNDLRNKVKASYMTPEGNSITLKSDDVRSIEHYRKVRGAQ